VANKSMFEDEGGVLWLVSDLMNISRFQQGRLVHLIGSEHPLPGSVVLKNIYSIVRDREGGIWFASGLLEPEGRGALPDGLQVDGLGFAVYAHHARASLGIAIENAFPITRRLVGTGFFAEMAGRFVAAHPPRHGWLSAYGEGFPEFCRPVCSCEEFKLPARSRTDRMGSHACRKRCE
jgi:streptogramin lyase